MTATQTLRAHLVPNESLNAVYEGQVETESERAAMTIGVTDRRLLGCGDEGAFVDVKQEYITSIQSTRRATSSVRGVDDRIVTAVGVAIAVLSVLGITLVAALAGTAGIFALGLSVAAIAGTTAAALAFRQGAGFEAFDRTQPLESLSEAEPVTTLSLDEAFDFELDLEADRQRLGLAGGASAVIAVVSFGWLLLSGSVLAAGLVASALVGLAVAGYGRSLENEYEGLEFETTHQKHVEITTVDGRTLTIRTDSSADLECELGCWTTQRQEFPLESVQYETR
ncbi:hypothetical protein G6M89_09135 [Natronolimnobius sp. AArcel1]|uniref:hypothetical protein n=1 Tax=Natronolimnobius sp. AArcel1 TaxID=1679093 RepID=UPI0013EB0737|nr:hypothetical protein [Natronolimnobius sp. AArcel1]NGM69167.1 hypothetical protein [Natronolimnobius sp. AArcel1]